VRAWETLINQKPRKFAIAHQLRSMFPATKDNKEHGDVFFQREKLFSAIFYGISSILVIFTNKWLMTTFNFPYFKFVAAVQFITTSIILLILAVCKKVDIPWLTPQIFREIMPVSLMFLGNVLCGLGSTKSLNIPMFTALRRFSILMTMLGEWWFLNQVPATSVVVSVGLMVGGAGVAALYDLAYDATGYTMVFFNNVFTAMNGVWMRKAAMSGKCSKMGVLFYNSLFSGIMMLLYFVAEHRYYADMQAFPIQTSGIMSLGSLITNPLSSSAAENSAQPPNRHLLSGPSMAHPQGDSYMSDLYHSVESRLTRQLRAGEHDFDAVVSIPPPNEQEGGTAVLRQRDIPHSVTEAEMAATKARLSALNNQINQEIHRYTLLKQESAVSDKKLRGSGPALKAEAALDGGAEAAAVSKDAEGDDGVYVSTITQVTTFNGWGDWKFVAMLLVTCCMGSVLNYAIFLCTTKNSALTTAVVGTLKNVVTSYIGMVVFTDYAFTWVNFIGINISIVGSIYYTMITMKS
jgi:solute carrier family 35 protein